MARKSSRVMYSCVAFALNILPKAQRNFQKFQKNNRRPLCFNVEMLCISVRCCRSSIPPKNVSPAHFLRRDALPTAAAMSEFLKIYKHSKAVQGSRKTPTQCVLWEKETASLKTMRRRIRSRKQKAQTVTTPSPTAKQQKPRAPIRCVCRGDPVWSPELRRNNNEYLRKEVPQ